MPQTSSAPARNQESYWVSVLLASVAVLLAVGPFDFESPVAIPDPVPSSVTDTAPVRSMVSHPQFQLGTFTFECNECHRSTPVPNVAGHGLTKHMNVQMSHGMNTRCLNCHHPSNREVFVDDYGREIPWDQPQLLCAKCHGPVYRDWQHGSHGRINGYWDRSRGEQIRLKCVECHDPHHPPFPPLASAPPPRTLRVVPHHGEAHSGIRNPLRLTDNLMTEEHANFTGERQP